MKGHLNTSFPATIHSAGRPWVPVNDSISLTSPQITGQLKKKENELDCHHSEIL